MHFDFHENKALYIGIAVVLQFVDANLAFMKLQVSPQSILTDYGGAHSGVRKQEDQKLKVNLGYTSRSSLTWAT